LGKTKHNIDGKLGMPKKLGQVETLGQTSHIRKDTK
jgi:hypothetical protein